MAKAKRIKRTVTVKTKVPGYQLELSEGDADFLVALLSRSHGDSKKSPNKYRDRILGALRDATGTNPAQTEAMKHVKRGHVYWENYPNPDAGRLHVQLPEQPEPSIFDFASRWLANNTPREWLDPNAAIGRTLKPLPAGFGKEPSDGSSER